MILWVFENYENRWDLLFTDESDADVLLPPHYRDLAMGERVGLPDAHCGSVGTCPHGGEASAPARA